MFEPLLLVAPLIFFALNVLTPGPNVLNTIGTALGSGRAAAYGCAAACAIGVLGWAAAALLGAGALFAAVPELRDGLTALGALVLIYFAYRYLRRALGRSDAVQRIDGVTPRGAFSQALLVLATNPKALTTWIALLSIFPQISVSWVSMAAFGLGCAAVAGGRACGLCDGLLHKPRGAHLCQGVAAGERTRRRRFHGLCGETFGGGVRLLTICWQQVGC